MGIGLGMLIAYMQERKGLEHDRNTSLITNASGLPANLELDGNTWKSNRLNEISWTAAEEWKAITNQENYSTTFHIYESIHE